MLSFLQYSRTHGCHIPKGTSTIGFSSSFRFLNLNRTLIERLQTGPSFDRSRYGNYPNSILYSSFKRSKLSIIQLQHKSSILNRMNFSDDAKHKNFQQLSKSHSFSISSAFCHKNILTGISQRTMCIKASSSSSNFLINQLMKNTPGVGLAFGVGSLSFYIANYLGHSLLALQGISGASSSPISAVPVAIISGLLLNNFIPISPELRKALQPGLKMCTTTILRLGIVCVGMKLSMVDVLQLGAVGVPFVICTISTGLLGVTAMSRFMRLPPRLGSLIAAGTSICGVTAIVSLAPAIQATEREVAIAVANVVAFGLFGMLFYPYLAHSILEHSEQIGMFLGTAIHDTSQVMGAALSYHEMYGDEVVLKVAAVTKLTRNIFLAAVIPGLAWMHTSASNTTTGSWRNFVPFFVVGFVGMALFRSIGDYTLSSNGLAMGIMPLEDWKHLNSLVGSKISITLLSTAMAGVGLSTSFSVLKGIGPNPFIVGIGGAILVATVSFGMVLILGPYIPKMKESEHSVPGDTVKQ